REIQISLEPFNLFPLKFSTRTSRFPSLSNDQTWFSISAQVIRSPSLLKYIPLDLPDSSVKVLSSPEEKDHLIILLLGWSVKNTFPSLSTAGPSVNPKPSPSFSTTAFFATSFFIPS